MGNFIYISKIDEVSYNNCLHSPSANANSIIHSLPFIFSPLGRFVDAILTLFQLNFPSQKTKRHRINLVETTLKRR